MGKKEKTTLNDLIKLGLRRFTRDTYAPGSWAEVVEVENVMKMHLHIPGHDVQVDLDTVQQTGWKAVIA